jgi:uncharacterized membrane protein YoaT (DUF817 family)
MGEIRFFAKGAAWMCQRWQALEAGQLNWPNAWSLVVLGEFAQRELLP